MAIFIKHQLLRKILISQ